MTNSRLACLLAALFVLLEFLSPLPTYASLLVDLRAVSGSGVTFESTKSVIVTAASVGGVIDFEMWGVVRANNLDILDDSLRNFSGSLLTTHFGRGGVSGSLVNAGETTTGLALGLLAPFNTGASNSNGKLQNLDSDPDFEIGGTVAADLLIGRVDPRLPNPVDENGGALAEFLMYRFSLPITSILARDSFNDYTVVGFRRYAPTVSVLWYEDGRAQNAFTSIQEGSGVWVHLPGLPESRRFAAANEPVPEPATIALALLAFAAVACVRRRRRVSPS